MMEAKMTSYNATMYLSTPSAVALTRHEIMGQLSDGMWENSRPYDHWRWWCNVEVALSDVSHVEVAVGRDLIRGAPAKNNYNLSKLIPVIGARMLKIGRMARAGADVTNYNIFLVAAYMPETLEEFEKFQSTGSWPCGTGSWRYTPPPAHTAEITPDLARAYYTATYTKKDLKSDLKLISDTMKTVKPW